MDQQSKIQKWYYAGTWLPNSSVYYEAFKDNTTAPYIGTWLPGTGVYNTLDETGQRK